jgi:hypothetical protein
MDCFYCKKEIEEKDLKFMLAIEVPYCNLWFHRECYTVNVKPQEVLYLAQNSEMIYTYTYKDGKNKKK